MADPHQVRDEQRQGNRALQQGGETVGVDNAMCCLQVEKHGEKHDRDIFLECVGVRGVRAGHLPEESIQTEKVLDKPEVVESGLRDEGVDEEELSNNEFI